MGNCGRWAWYHSEHGISPWFCGGAMCHRKKCQVMFWQKRVGLISALIEEHNLWNFFTLTLDRSKTCAKESWDYVSHVWSKTRKRLRNYYDDFRFVAVLEYHPKSLKETGEYWPHVHGFTNELIPQEMWSAVWEICGGGEIVDVRKVSNEIGEYVSKEVGKYVGKQNLLEAYARRGTHRTLWRTKGMKCKKELTKEEGWHIIEEWLYKDGEISKKEDEYVKAQDLARTQCAILTGCVEESQEVIQT